MHVDDDIRIAEGLPASAFIDRDWLARELGTIFRRSWLAVPEQVDDRPLVEQVAARGTRVPISLLGHSLFLQRGWEDEALRAFPNTCTHAWHPLVLGASRGPTLQCPQHGRRFDCAGRFVGQPGFANLPEFPRACDHLTALPVATWQRMAFVNLDPDAAPFAQPEVDASIAQLPPLAERGTVETREIAGNWKQHAWNFLDHFHIGYVHRAPHGLADAIDLASYKTELYDGGVLQWVYAQRAGDGFDPAHLPARFSDGSGRRVFALWWFLFPNLALNFYPWGLSVNVYQPIADRPGATRFTWFQYPMDAEKYAERETRWLSSQVDAEDVETLALVGRGLRSGFAPRPRFSPEQERAGHWFHRAVARGVS